MWLISIAEDKNKLLDFNEIINKIDLSLYKTSNGEI